MVSRLFLWKEKSSQSLPSRWSHPPRDLFVLTLLHSKSCLCSFSLQKQAPELQSHCPANPAAGSWQKAGVGLLAGFIFFGFFFFFFCIRLFHTHLSPGIRWHWDSQFVCMSCTQDLIYMFWGGTDLRLGWEGVFSVRDNSVFMGQGWRISCLQQHLPRSRLLGFCSTS